MAMDEATLRTLASPRGEDLLRAAKETRDLPAHRRASALAACPEGRGASPTEIRAALQQDDLRRRARARCPHAETLLFTRTGLEQATAWPVAEERAGRWPGPVTDRLHDLTAGIGLDALATALTGRPVLAFEPDPVRACLLAANARALGVAPLVEVRVERAATGRGPLAFLDPDRRATGRRTRAPEHFDPPARDWPALLGGYAASMLKLPPASRVPVPPGARLEVVSLDGRARERRLLAGGLGLGAPRRALALPAGLHVEGPGLPWPAPRRPEPGLWLLDPDPAVTLAGLVGDLALAAGLAPVHPRIAYLVGAAPPPTAPGRPLRIDAVLPARTREIQAWLRARHVGTLEIKTRGVDDDAGRWRARLRLRGEASAWLAVTRGPDDRWMALAGMTRE